MCEGEGRRGEGRGAHFGVSTGSALLAREALGAGVTAPPVAADRAAKVWGGRKKERREGVSEWVSRGRDHVTGTGLTLAVALPGATAALELRRGEGGVEEGRGRENERLRERGDLR